MKTPKNPIPTRLFARQSAQKGLAGARAGALGILGKWFGARVGRGDATAAQPSAGKKSGPDHNTGPADKAFRRRPQLPSPLPGATPWERGAEAHLRNKVETTLMGGRHWTKNLEAILKQLSERPSAPGRSSFEDWVNGRGRESSAHMQGRDASLLSHAIDSANPKIARFLLEFGSDPRVVNSDGSGPMFQCVKVADRIRNSLDPEKARANCKGLVSVLLEFGGNPNEQLTRTDPQDAESLLARAARTREIWLFEALVAAGARADHPGAAGQPVLCDLAGNSAELVPFFEKLVAVGARVDGRGENSMTPFLVAAQWRNKVAAKELARLGADREARDAHKQGWRELLANPPSKLWSPERFPADEIYAWLESLEIQDELGKSGAKENAASAKSSRGRGTRNIAAQAWSQAGGARKKGEGEVAGPPGLAAVAAADETAVSAATAPKRKSRRL